MSHLTAHSPATSVLRVRIWGDSGRGPVTSLPRGSLIATYLYYPSNYNPDYHSPVLAGVPDGWSFGSDDKLKAFADRLLSTGVPTKIGAAQTLEAEMNGKNGPMGQNGGGLHPQSIRMQKTFMPLVLAEDVTVRKSSPNADWADTYVSAALSGVTELHGKWCSGAGCNSGVPGIMFQGGEEFWVYLDCTNNEGRQDCILSAQPSVAARRGCLESYLQICKPLGEFVHPPLRLSHDSRELISGVYIDPLTSKALRQAAGTVTGLRRAKFEDAPDFRDLLRNDYALTGTLDENTETLERLEDDALFVAGQIPDRNDEERDALGGVTRAAGANNNTFTTFVAAIADLSAARAAATGSGDPQLALSNARDAFATDGVLRRVFVIFRDLAQEVRTGPGLRFGGTQDRVIRETRGLIPRYSIDLRVYKFLGGRVITSKTQSAEQTNALSGHGTALVQLPILPPAA